MEQTKEETVFVKRYPSKGELPEKEGTHFVSVTGPPEDEFTIGEYHRFVRTFEGNYWSSLSKNKTVNYWLEEVPLSSLSPQTEATEGAIDTRELIALLLDCHNMLNDSTSIGGRTWITVKQIAIKQMLERLGGVESILPYRPSPSVLPAVKEEGRTAEDFFKERYPETYEYICRSQPPQKFEDIFSAMEAYASLRASTEKQEGGKISEEILNKYIDDVIKQDMGLRQSLITYGKIVQSLMQ